MAGVASCKRLCGVHGDCLWWVRLPDQHADMTCVVAQSMVVLQCHTSAHAGWQCGPGEASD